MAINNNVNVTQQPVSTPSNASEQAAKQAFTPNLATTSKSFDTAKADIRQAQPQNGSYTAGNLGTNQNPNKPSAATVAFSASVVPNRTPAAGESAYGTNNGNRAAGSTGNGSSVGLATLNAVKERPGQGGQDQQGNRDNSQSNLGNNGVGASPKRNLAEVSETDRANSLAATNATRRDKNGRLIAEDSNNRERLRKIGMQSALVARDVLSLYKNHSQKNVRVLNSIRLQGYDAYMAYLGGNTLMLASNKNTGHAHIRHSYATG